MSRATIQQTVTNTGTTVSSVTAVLPNLLPGGLIIVAWGTSGTFSAVSDTLGSTFNLIDTATPVNNTFKWWYIKNTNSGNNTITVSSTGNASHAIIAREYRGILNPITLDKHVIATDNTGSITALSSGASASTTSNNELVLGFGGGESSSSSYTVGAGFGNMATALATADRIALEDKYVIGSQAAQTATFTLSPATNWACGVATFIMGNAQNVNNLRPAIFKPGLAR